MNPVRVQPQLRSEILIPYLLRSRVSLIFNLKRPTPGMNPVRGITMDESRYNYYKVVMVIGGLYIMFRFLATNILGFRKVVMG